MQYYYSPLLRPPAVFGPGCGCGARDKTTTKRFPYFNTPAHLTITIIIHLIISGRTVVVVVVVSVLIYYQIHRGTTTANLTPVKTYKFLRKKRNTALSAEQRTKAILP